MAVAYRPKRRSWGIEVTVLMSSEASCDQWFAVQVRTRWEASTAVLLGGKGYETLLPTYKTKRRWGGRAKELSAPLFPGYVFCRFDAHKRLPVLVTPGVISIVGRGKMPAAVAHSEVASIQALVSSGFQAEPWPFLEIGQRVRVESEPLCGLEGFLLSFKGSSRIVVSVSLLQRSVALEIDRSCVTPIAGSRTAVSSRPVPARLLQGGMA